MTESVSELLLEHHRIRYRALARRMARAIVQATDEKLRSVLGPRRSVDMRRMARKFATCSNDELDRKLPKFFEMLQLYGFGGDNFEGWVDDFCEQIKMEA